MRCQGLHSATPQIPSLFNYTPSLPTLSVLVNPVTIPAKASKLISLRAGEEGWGEGWRESASLALSCLAAAAAQMAQCVLGWRGQA